MESVTVRKKQKVQESLEAGSARATEEAESVKVEDAEVPEGVREDAASARLEKAASATGTMEAEKRQSQGRKCQSGK